MLTCFACGDRLCEPCQRKRRQQLQDRVQCAVVDSPQNVRFFTFTLRHNSTPLRDQIQRLRLSLRRLHHDKWWQKHAAGGVDIIELKRGKTGKTWHVHAHCLVSGCWIDQADLARKWNAITGDSSIVDVRDVNSPEYAAKYVTKYATKPISEGVLLDPDALDEAVCALKGARMISSWGTWRNLIRDDDDDQGSHLEPLGTINELVGASLAGDAGARLYLQMACMRWPSLEHVLPPNAIACLGPAPPGAPIPGAPDESWRDTQAEQLPF